MPGTVAVITDSSACLTPELLLAWGLAAVPLQVVIEDVARPESDVDGAQVVAALVAGARVTTSQPSPEACAAAVRGSLDAGASAVVAVSISANLSGTHGAFAALAAQEPRLLAVDSRTVAFPLGAAAAAAAWAARDGADAPEVARVAASVAASSACLVTVDSLEYLRRGGRLGAAAATVGDALGVRPVLTVRGGGIEVAAAVRSTAKARAEVAARALDATAAMRNPLLGIMTLPGDEDVAAEAAAALGGVQTMRVPLSAALAAHTGPGTLAIGVADMPLGWVGA